uniref:Coat prtein n=2 Tax=Olivavirus actinidiae TaxID=2024724 RepID=A0A7L9CC15_9CLOS|nr:Coat prtein [Actinidia virus 1]
MTTKETNKSNVTAESSGTTHDFMLGELGIDVATLTTNVEKIKKKGFFDLNTNKMYNKEHQDNIHKALRESIHSKYATLKANDDTVWPTLFTQILCRVAIRQTSGKTNYTESITYYGGSAFDVAVDIPDREIRNFIIQAAHDAGTHPNPERKFFRAYSGMWLKICQAGGDKALENTSLAAKWGLPQDYRALTPDFMEATNDMSDEYAEALRLKTREAVSSAPSVANAPLLNTSLLSRQFTSGYH